MRITHWLNAIAIFVMIGSGWRIYNQEPLFGSVSGMVSVKNNYPGRFWEDYGYNWFSGS